MYIKDKTEKLNIRIDSDLKYELTKFAKMQNMSISKFIRFILVSYIISLKEITDDDNQKRYSNKAS